TRPWSPCRLRAAGNASRGPSEPGGEDRAGAPPCTLQPARRPLASFRVCPALCERRPGYFLARCSWANTKSTRRREDAENTENCPAIFLRHHFLNACGPHTAHETSSRRGPA